MERHLLPKECYPYIKSLCGGGVDNLAMAYRRADAEGQKALRGEFIKRHTDHIKTWLEAAYEEKYVDFSDDKKEKLVLFVGAFWFGIFLVLNRIHFLQQDDSIDTHELQIAHCKQINHFSLVQGEQNNQTVVAIVTNLETLSQLGDFDRVAWLIFGMMPPEIDTDTLHSVDALDRLQVVGTEEIAHFLCYNTKRLGGEDLYDFVDRIRQNKSPTSVDDYKKDELERRAYKWKRYLAPKAFKEGYMKLFEDLLANRTSRYASFEEYKKSKDETYTPQSLV